MSTPLNRQNHGRPAAPVRIVHIGLGNFHRAHQAWYTEHASDANQWGIAAFTGRRPTMAELLAPQDGLYTLITRKAEGDAYEVISSISAVHPSSDFQAFIGYFTTPELAIVTSTVTEAGYYRTDDGSLDVDNTQVAADLEALKELADAGDVTAEKLGALELTTTPVKVLAGLIARRNAGLGGLTVLPCDNLPDNGPSFKRVVRDAAQVADPSVTDWLEAEVSFATGMVDRITPGLGDDDLANVQQAQGYDDASPVGTEPFSEWVISGDFVAGRPDWEAAGVQIVDDVVPYEHRKLWMLNGSHSLMAYAGPALGCETVYDAISHPTMREWVQAWWSEAGPELPVSWEDYASALLERFENPSMRDVLARIAADGSVKIPVRFIPVLRLFRQRGELSAGAVRAVAAWVLHLRREGQDVVDANAARAAALVGDDLPTDAARVVAFVAPDLADDTELIEAVVASAEKIESLA